MIQVTQALTFYITANRAATAIPVVAPDPTPSIAPTTDTAPTAATYAEVVDRRPPSRITSLEPTSHQHRASSSPSPSTLPKPAGTPQTTRVIIRLDLNSTNPMTRPDPEDLYPVIETAMRKNADDIMEQYLRGVQWTKRGNLVLHPSPEICTAEFLRLRKAEIWAAIRPLLGLPTKYPRPRFECDDPWHSVVIRGIPMPSSRTPESFTLNGIRSWIDPAAVFVGDVKAFSVLCRPEDYPNRHSLAVRVSLSAEADARWLVENGTCFYGA
ncbi:hypothetical protein DFH09DRAFT_1271941 [Mycena vulgaris]|nr:hypothetical protein DFH09DRAFT_1271941 [Mycena vulgaris]